MFFNQLLLNYFSREYSAHSIDRRIPVLDSSNGNRSSIVAHGSRETMSIAKGWPCNGGREFWSKEQNIEREKVCKLSPFFRIIHVGVMCTLIGRVWGSRLRLRCAWLSLLCQSRRLYHRLLFGHWRGWGVLSWRHPFVYSVQTLRLGERSDFVVRRETLESCRYNNLIVSAIFRDQD